MAMTARLGSLTSLLTAVALVTALCVASLAGFAATGEAQGEQVSCPAGWTPSADGSQCLSDAVDDNVVTTTSCLQGVLSEDGTTCVVPRLDAAPATPAVTAPVPTFTG